ncbi:transposase, partial [Streptosporangium sp. NPDC049644]|uniref:transposase n=1 Tax=Streptosporangium sp. NPDC049644 TaxID=3155507 RepID=UPI00343674E3
VGCPPKVVLAALVDSLKGVSARLLRKEYPAVRRYLRGGRLRSPSYFAASCGGALLSLQKIHRKPGAPGPTTGRSQPQGREAIPPGRERPGFLAR